MTQGIIFTTLNTSLPGQPEEISRAQGFGYVGAPNYAAGFALATEAAKRSGPAGGRQGLRLGPARARAATAASAPSA